MIRAWQSEILLAAGLLALAHLTAGPPRDAGRDTFRDAIRPLLLPTAWARFDAASRAGDPGELLAAGRVVTGLMPGWTDGAIHFAWICAFELARDHPDRDALTDLMLAVDSLQQAADERRQAMAMEDAAELLLAAATIVDHRTDLDPELAARFRVELGRDPSVTARDLVAEAARTAPNDATRSRLVTATMRLIAGAVRMGDLDRAEASIAAAQRTLATLTGNPDAADTLTALRRLRPLSDYLEDPEALAALAHDPALADLAEALRSLRK